MASGSDSARPWRTTPLRVSAGLSPASHPAELAAGLPSRTVVFSFGGQDTAADGRRYSAGVDTGDFIVIDVETAGGNWSSFPLGFDLLLTGTKSGPSYGAYTAAPESLAQLADLLKAWSGPVVTFNGARFDLPILDHWLSTTLDRRIEVANHYDLFAAIRSKAGRPISLDRLSRYTFGEEKVAWDHRNNAQSWAQEPELMVDYNRTDLDLTHELFMRVLRGEPLFLDDTSVVLPLPDDNPA